MSEEKRVDDAVSSESSGLNTEAAKLLQQIEQTRRGRLKFFFGAAPGVGKTYAMLQEAREKRNEGLDVLIGWVDTHKRKDTEALVEGLDVLPRKKIRYNNFNYEEFDIDEVLKRRPALVIVDELAHSNAPTSRHSKRWQDVEELLASGIDVYTAMNVQHLETLNNVVEKMTGVTVTETVPDRLFEDAYEVRFVDLPPNDLIGRLRAGKIYLRETIEAAMHGFFKKSNLVALRELALRKMAQRVTEFDRSRGSVNESGSVKSGILLYLNDIDSAEILIRECSRLSYSMQVPWTALWVDDGTSSEEDRGKINSVLRLAEELDGTVHVAESMSAEATLGAYAGTKGISMIMASDDAIGWRLKRRLMSLIPSLELLLISTGKKKDKTDVFKNLRKEFLNDGWWQSFFTISILTVALIALRDYLTLDIIAILYLFPIIFIALRFGRFPAVLGVVLSALSFDLFFVEPRMSLSVANSKYMILLIAMLCVGLSIGTVISRLKKISQTSARRALQTQTLFALSNDLGRALQLEDIEKSVSQQIAELNEDVTVKLWECLDDTRVLKPVGDSNVKIDEAIAQWVVKHGEEAGCGTHTLSSSPYLYLPLKGSVRVRGVMAFISENKSIYNSIEFKHLAHSMATAIAQTFERLHYVEVSQKTLVEMEAQKFRHTLISELSHDLRTPLAVLLTSAETLEQSLRNKNYPEIELAEEMLDNIAKMTRLTDNLLEMARLQSSSIQLNQDWLPVEDVFGSALASMPDALLKKFKISVEVAPDVPPLYADASLVNRVLVNFLDNATKYCDEGASIKLTASACGQKIMLSVIDNGPGLPADPSRLFDPFRRGSKESGKLGIGLGLSISKMIARVHQGQIVAANNPSGGSKFTLILPVKKMPEIEEEEAETSAEEAKKE